MGAKGPDHTRLGSMNASEGLSHGWGGRALPEKREHCEPGNTAATKIHCFKVHGLRSVHEIPINSMVAFPGFTVYVSAYHAGDLLR